MTRQSDGQYMHQLYLKIVHQLCGVYNPCHFLCFPCSSGVEDIDELQTNMALQMDQEFSRCSVESFFATYLPFSPSDKDVDAFMLSQRARKEDNCAPVDQVTYQPTATPFNGTRPLGFLAT